MTIIKKVFVVILSIVLLAGLLPANAFAAETGGAAGYSDTADSYAKDAIDRWSNGANPVLKGQVEGELFGPKDPMKTVDLAITINRMFGVYNTPWYQSPVATREQAAKMLAEAFGIEPKAAVAPGEQFLDHAEINPELAGYVYALKDLDIMGGFQGYVTPKEPFTREQVITIIDERLSAIVDTAADTELISYPETVVVRQSGVTLTGKTIGGDLIIGHGVGDGDVVLDNVTVRGRLIAYGGGENSIVIRNSKIGGVIAAKTTSQKTNFKLEGESGVGNVSVKPNSRMIITGYVPELNIGPNAQVVLADGAEVGVINMTGANGSLQMLGDSSAGQIVLTEGAANSKLDLVANSKVDGIESSAPRTNIGLSGNAAVGSVTMNGDETKLQVSGSAEVKEAEVNANGITLGGSGSVDKVHVSENVTSKTVVTTPGTTIDNESGEDVVNGSGGIVVEAGDSNASSGQGNGSTGNRPNRNDDDNDKDNDKDNDDDNISTVTISSVSVMVALPAGEAVPQTTVTGGTGYTGTIGWFDETNGKAMSSSDKFAEDRTYTATVTLSSKSGYKFTSSTEVNVSPSGFSGSPSVNSSAAKLIIKLTYITSVTEEPSEDQIAADRVADMIAALPEAGEVALGDKADIMAAETAFSKLTAAQQSLVENSEKLADCLETIMKLEDEAAATVVEELIDALPDVGSLTLSDMSDVETALKAYEELTEGQKELVDSSLVSKLGECKAKMDELVAGADNQQLADTIIDMIASIANGADSLTLADRSKVDAARDAYDNASEAVKALVDNEGDLQSFEEQIAKIEAAIVNYDDALALSSATFTVASWDAYEDAIADDKIDTSASTLAEIETAVDAIETAQDELVTIASVVENFKSAHMVLEETTGTIAIGDKTAVTTALTAYGELPAEVKSALTAEKALLDSLLAKIAELESNANTQELANAIIARITALGSVADLTLSGKANVAEVRAEYTNASAAVQALVMNEQTLQNLEEQIVKIEAAIADYDDALTLASTAYTIASWDAYEDAIADDKIDTSASTLAEIETAVDAIETAQDALITIASVVETFRSAHTVLEETTDTIAIGDKTAVTTALAAYGELPAEVKSALTAEKALLDSLLAKIAELESNANTRELANAIIAKITVLGSAADLTLSDKADVAEVRAEYTNASAAVQALVTNEQTLQNLGEQIIKIEAAIIDYDDALALSSAAFTVESWDTYEDAIADDMIDTSASTLAEIETAVGAIETAQDELVTIASVVEAFRSAHTVLEKTTDTIAIGDKTAVTTALTAYVELPAEVKSALTAEKALLDNLLAKIAELENVPQVKTLPIANVTYKVAANNPTSAGTIYYDSQADTITIGGDEVLTYTDADKNFALVKALLLAPLGEDDTVTFDASGKINRIIASSGIDKTIAIDANGAIKPEAFAEAVTVGGSNGNGTTLTIEPAAESNIAWTEAGSYGKVDLSHANIKGTIKCTTGTVIVSGTQDVSSSGGTVEAKNGETTGTITSTGSAGVRVLGVLVQGNGATIKQTAAGELTIGGNTRSITVFNQATAGTIVFSEDFPGDVTLIKPDVTFKLVGDAKMTGGRIDAQSLVAPMTFDLSGVSGHTGIGAIAEIYKNSDAACIVNLKFASAVTGAKAPDDSAGEGFSLSVSPFTGFTGVGSDTVSLSSGGAATIKVSVVENSVAKSLSNRRYTVAADLVNCTL